MTRSLQLRAVHELLYGTAHHKKLFAVHLLPGLIGSVDFPAGLPDTLDIRFVPT